MFVLNIISWISVVLVLGAYAYKPHLYHWANCLLAIPICLPAIITHAYSSAAISIAFGFIAITKLRR